MMVITNIVAQFSLNDHQVVFQNDHSLSVQDNQGNQVQSYSLKKNTWWITAQKDVASGETFVLIGEGNLAGQFFPIVFQPRAEYTAFKISKSSGAVGISDLRDLRVVQHEFDLLQLTIALESDGVFLKIFCPGDKDAGPVPGYTETPIN